MNEKRRKYESNGRGGLPRASPRALPFEDMIKGDADWNPAVSICSGYGAGGLPVAIQLAGKPFQEVTALRVADAFEKAMPWRDRRPSIA
jgi:hypothetical protein